MRIGVLPGTFNPPTRAHLALAEAALRHVDRVVFVLPRMLPHKNYGGVAFEDRLQMIRTVAGNRFDVVVTEGGLLVEIADELRVLGEIIFLCGRDAAERIAGWDYGEPDAFPRMLERFEMLVACRNGDYAAPAELKGRIQPLPLASDCDHISATEVRERIARGSHWEELVPEVIQNQVLKLYGGGEGAAGS